ncbi:hypothetical protein H9P43_001613 [Blastocladiella emersonii ATCC 22665]|nr:hypothetical protein H9P43_001613 [Blastocladiella emersonii ATCC 22665]
MDSSPAPMEHPPPASPSAAMSETSTMQSTPEPPLIAETAGSRRSSIVPKSPRADSASSMASVPSPAAAHDDGVRPESPAQVLETAASVVSDVEVEDHASAAVELPSSPHDEAATSDRDIPAEPSAAGDYEDEEVELASPTDPRSPFSDTTEPMLSPTADTELDTPLAEEQPEPEPRPVLAVDTSAVPPPTPSGAKTPPSAASPPPATPLSPASIPPSAHFMAVQSPVAATFPARSVPTSPITAASVPTPTSTVHSLPFLDEDASTFAAALPDRPMTAEWEAKLPLLAQARARGNAAFQLADYPAALTAYSQAARHFEINAFPDHHPTSRRKGAGGARRESIKVASPLSPTAAGFAPHATGGGGLGGLFRRKPRWSLSSSSSASAPSSSSAPTSPTGAGPSVPRRPVGHGFTTVAETKSNRMSRLVAGWWENDEDDSGDAWETLDTASSAAASRSTSPQRTSVASAPGSGTPDDALPSELAPVPLRTWFPESPVAVLPRQVRREAAHVYANRSATLVRMAGNAPRSDEPNALARRALADADRAVQLDPGWAKAHFRRADALLALERFAAAQAALHRVAVLDPAAGASAGVLTRRDRARWAVHDAMGGLRIVQLISGRDFCVAGTVPRWAVVRTVLHAYARQMQNCMYIVADVGSKQCVVVDPAWDPEAVLDQVRARGWTLAGIAIGHAHVDHVGGQPPPPFDRYRVRVPGLRAMVKAAVREGLAGGKPVPVYLHPAERAILADADATFATDTKLDRMRTMVDTGDGHTVRLGRGTVLEFWHTPGHTPGSQCILVNGNRILSSDTLFAGAVGRCDLPGGDPAVMRNTLRRLRARLPEAAVILPGHSYGAVSTTVSRERRSGGALDPIMWQIMLAADATPADAAAPMPVTAAPGFAQDADAEHTHAHAHG